MPHPSSPSWSLHFSLVAGLGSLLLACGTSSATGDATASGSPSTGSSLTASSGSAAGGGGTGGGGTGGHGATGGGAPSCDSGFPVAPMPLLSKDAPVFASSGDAKGAKPGVPGQSWSASEVPAWIAYDLSSAPAAQRQNVLLSWYSIHSGCYIDEASNAGAHPLSYTFEINSAPGGGSPPTDGWTEVVLTPKNRYCGRQHFTSLEGASWVRMNISSSTDPASVEVQFDVQSAPACASDSWLFMGDSITYMTMTHAFCDLPELVVAAKPTHWPAVLDAAIGGTNTGTASLIIDDTMMDFPGRFVVLAYGTNDGPDGYAMEGLVQKVIAAGKTPVVPHMPWADGKLDVGPKINAQIDALYVKYPAIVKGPDLWTLFENRTDLIPPGDVHPNDEGREVLRKAWAETMVGVYE